MPATKPTAPDEPLVIVENVVERLAEIGRADIAEQLRTFAGTLARDTVSVDEAATLASVSPATIKNWIGRGIVVSHQVGKGKRHQIDRASLAHAIQRRAQVDAARAAFVTPERAAEFLSGLDKDTLQRLGGV